MRKPHYILVCFFLWISASVGASWAGEPTTVVQGILNDAMDITSRPDLQGKEHRKERFEAIKQLISKHFLTEKMASDSLKQHWDSLSSEQRAEFAEIFSDLFQNSYTTMVVNFLERETIEYREEHSVSEKVEVETVILRANEHIPVDYHLLNVEGAWLIEDVEIDGVSIVRNYQNAFHRVIVNESYEGLLRKMQIQRAAITD